MGLSVKIKATARAPVLEGRTLYWSAMRDAGEFTIAEIADRCGVTLGTIRRYLRPLAKLGYVVTAGRGRYRLRARAPIEAPLKGTRPEARLTRQHQIWNAIRALKTFTVVELAVAASTEEAPIRPRTAKDYVCQLRAAGYLQIVQRKGFASAHTYRLRPAMSTGPMPPAILRARVVYDRNMNAIVGEAIGKEVSL